MRPPGRALARERDGAAGSDDKAALGISVAPLTPDLAAEAKLPRNTHGVVVQDVNPDGRAADAGIQAGDIILEVNRQPVQSIEELRAAVRKSPDRPTLLLVNREGTNLCHGESVVSRSSTSAQSRGFVETRRSVGRDGGQPDRQSKSGVDGRQSFARDQRLAAMSFCLTALDS